MNETKNFAARMGRWSAQHRKKAIFGWIAFVDLSLVIGSALGVKAPEDDTTYVGDSGKAHQLVDEHFPTENTESIIVKGTECRRRSRAARPTRPSPRSPSSKDVYDVQSPVRQGQREPDLQGRRPCS